MTGRDTRSQATHLQLCQFIGQDFVALNLWFDNQKDFNDSRIKHLNWKYAMKYAFIHYLLLMYE
jgi:hypothetical protein